jgi:hypothetical protein
MYAPKSITKYMRKWQHKQCQKSFIKFATGMKITMPKTELWQPGIYSVCPCLLSLPSIKSQIDIPGIPYGRERISTVDLLAPTSSDQLFYILKLCNILIFLQKQVILIRRSTVLRYSLQ